MSRAIIVRDGFDPVPSIAELASLTVTVTTTVPATASTEGVAVSIDGAVPADLQLDRAALAAAGFTGAPGQSLLVPGGARLLVAVGVGDPAALDMASVRDAAAAYSNAAARHGELVVSLEGLSGLGIDVAAQAVVEGVVLARYGYGVLQRNAGGRTPLTALTLVTSADSVDAATAGAERGRIFATAASLARDLANSPPAHLTATRIAEVAVDLGATRGLEVEVFDRDALVELGIGGLIAVNGGSAEPPRMVKLTYTPSSPSGAKLTLVGKGIMYDSGGISLKPSDAVHATMKTDMSGAGNVLAVMSALTALDCPTAVTAYLMCTDNMPSGTALNLGDVMTIRGGTTVEVMNTDAEGRLVMADALVLAAEEPTDAIIDMATLTGACVVALGSRISGVLGNNQALVDQLTGASALTDEPLWQLPLTPRYRPQLNSEVADMKNMGGPMAGTITAALFLSEFVGDVPWAHIDIAGTAQNEVPERWTPKGATGFGTRLLLEFILSFTGIPS